MNRRRLRTNLALAAGVVLLAAAEPYHDADRHFAFVLPDGWGVMPDVVLNAANELAKQQASSTRYFAGFQPTGKPISNGPYVLLQDHEGQLSGYTYERLEESFLASLPRVKGVKGIVIQPGALKGRLDRNRNRFVTDLQSTVAGFVKMRGRSYGMIGADRIVYLHCYSPDERFDQDLPTFESMADSFQYDDGYTFVPGSGRPFHPGLDLAAGLVGGAVLGGAILLFYLARALGRRIKRRRESL